MKNRFEQHELNKDKHKDWELEHFCDSHNKCRSQAEKYGFRRWEFPTSFLILLKWDELFVLK